MKTSIWIVTLVLVTIAGRQARADEDLKSFAGAGGSAGGVIRVRSTGADFFYPHQTVVDGGGGIVGPGIGASVRARGDFSLLSAIAVGGVTALAPAAIGSAEAVAALATPEIAEACSFDLGLAVQPRGGVAMDWAPIDGAQAGEVRVGARAGIVCRIGQSVADYLSISGAASSPLSIDQPVAFGGNVTVAKDQVFFTLNADETPLGREHAVDVSTIFAAKAGRVFVGADIGVNQRLDKLDPDKYHQDADTGTSVTAQAVVGAAF